MTENLLQQSIATQRCSLSTERERILNASNMLINVEVGAQNHLIISTIHFSIQMSTEMKDVIKAIRVLPLSGLQSDWDKWSEKYQWIAVLKSHVRQ